MYIYFLPYKFIIKATLFTSVAVLNAFYTVFLYQLGEIIPFYEEIDSLRQLQVLSLEKQVLAQEEQIQFLTNFSFGIALFTIGVLLIILFFEKLLITSDKILEKTKELWHKLK